VPLGNTQVTVLPVAQLASVAGVYGLSALVVSVNAALAYALLSVRRTQVVTAVVTSVVLVGIATWGALRVADGSLTRDGAPLQVGLIQGNIAQEDKWNPDEARRIFTTYIAMTRDAVRRGAEFVIWPESSTPFMFEEDAVGGGTVRSLARELGVLKEWLYFVSPLVDQLAEFAPGTSVVPLPVGPNIVSTAICYEIVYPALARQSVADGSQLLTTITNDAWYGQSSAPYQHFEMASMRAIEQGRYLARAANTGISGVVDPYGRVVRRSGIFEQEGIVAEVRLLTSRTIYSVIGDAVAHLSIMLTVGLLAAAEWRTLRRS
jgi:apolipoprotein N-acyltransferase